MQSWFSYFSWFWCVFFFFSLFLYFFFRNKTTIWSRDGVLASYPGSWSAPLALPLGCRVVFRKISHGLGLHWIPGAVFSPCLQVESTDCTVSIPFPKRRMSLALLCHPRSSFVGSQFGSLTKYVAVLSWSPLLSPVVLSMGCSEGLTHLFLKKSQRSCSWIMASKVFCHTTGEELWWCPVINYIIISLQYIARFWKGISCRVLGAFLVCFSEKQYLLISLEHCRACLGTFWPYFSVVLLL